MLLLVGLMEVGVGGESERVRTRGAVEPWLLRRRRRRGSERLVELVERAFRAGGGRLGLLEGRLGSGSGRRRGRRRPRFRFRRTILELFDCLLKPLLVLVVSSPRRFGAPAGMLHEGNREEEESSGGVEAKGRKERQRAHLGVEGSANLRNGRMRFGKKANEIELFRSGPVVRPRARTRCEETFVLILAIVIALSDGVERSSRMLRWIEFERESALLLTSGLRERKANVRRTRSDIFLNASVGVELVRRHSLRSDSSWSVYQILIPFLRAREEASGRGKGTLMEERSRLTLDPDLAVEPVPSHPRRPNPNLNPNPNPTLSCE